MRIDTKVLKNLLPGLLPLFVFVVADELWGSLVGLYVAMGFGVLELAITYLKTGKVEKFILLDLGLLLILGLVSVLLKDDIYFKLKPAFIEFIFAVIIAVSLFSKKNILFAMSLRYMKDVKLNPGAELKFNRNLKAILFITIFHIFLVVYSSYYMSKEAWAFISGFLFYILVLGYFGIEFLRMRYINKKSEPEEILPIVDEEGKVTGQATRGECHFNPGTKLMHPVVHMHVLNEKGDVFLQHRLLSKKVQPGKWDTAVGGHIAFGEDIELSLKREAEEEIGIRNFQAKFITKYTWETEVEKELVFMFFCSSNGEFKINPEEISEGRFWSKKEIIDNMGKGIFTSNFEKEYYILSEAGIINNGGRGN